MRVAVANADTGLVLSVIELETMEVFDPGPSLIAVDAGEQTVYAGCSWSGEGGFVEPPAPEMPLEEAKAARIVALTQACAAAIVGGYSSSALGAPHTYPSAITDQINMMGSVTASLLPDLPEGWATPFWCAAENSEWAFRMHSAEQIRQAGADGKAHVVACQTTLDSLSAMVTAASSVEDVAAVAWPAP